MGSSGHLQRDPMVFVAVMRLADVCSMFPEILEEVVRSRFVAVHMLPRNFESSPLPHHHHHHIYRVRRKK